VLREPNGRGGSAFVHDRLQRGAAVRVRGPGNNFPLTPGAPYYLMIAGGIGITPILPIIRELEDQGADWRLVYGGRSRRSMAFRDQLAEFGARVAMRPQDEYGLLNVRKWIKDSPAGTAVYCCGPGPLLAAVETMHAQLGKERTLHVERFHARPGALDGPRTAFEVELAQSGVTISVAPDQTIVEALDAIGMDVDTACREGVCGTCETRVLEGTPDHRDSFLSASERGRNDRMMICCSRAASPRLVLDL
jgi:ferredoxin-NADP reductase